MLKYIAKGINYSLKPLGISLNRVSPGHVKPPMEMVPQLLYKLVVEELHDCLSEYKFPELPYTDGRNELMLKLAGTTISEAMWILNSLHQSMKVDGDICEFGVAYGATSALIGNEIRSTQRNLWLFDSFEGLPKPTEKDVLIDDVMGLGSIEAYEGVFSYRDIEVRNRLQAINFPESRTKIVKGFIEETISSAKMPEKVAFAYIDFDFYEPILVTLNFLAKHLSVGGYIVVDDYGYFSSGAQSAVDEFVTTHQSTFKVEVPPKWARHFIVLHKIS